MEYAVRLLPSLSFLFSFFFFPPITTRRERGAGSFFFFFFERTRGLFFSFSAYAVRDHEASADSVHLFPFFSFFTDGSVKGLEEGVRPCQFPFLLSFLVIALLLLLFPFFSSCFGIKKRKKL